MLNYRWLLRLKDANCHETNCSGRSSISYDFEPRFWRLRRRICSTNLISPATNPTASLFIILYNIFLNNIIKYLIETISKNTWWMYEYITCVFQLTCSWHSSSRSNCQHAFWIDLNRDWWWTLTKLKHMIRARSEPASLDVCNGVKSNSIHRS